MTDWKWTEVFWLFWILFALFMAMMIGLILAMLIKIVIFLVYKSNLYQGKPSVQKVKYYITMIVMAISVLLLSFLILMVAQYDLDILFGKDYSLSDLKPHRAVLICSNISLGLFIFLLSIWREDIT